MNLAEAIWSGIIIAVIFGIVWTNPKGSDAVGNSLKGFTTGTIKALEVHSG